MTFLILVTLVIMLGYRVKWEDARYDRAQDARMHALCHPQAKGVRRD